MQLCYATTPSLSLKFLTNGKLTAKLWVNTVHSCYSHTTPLFYQVVEKELLIQEKEKLYMELKQILARQPGPEVAEQVQLYQQTLKDKTKRLKSMASELNMYEAQVKEYQYELERLSKELQEAKKKYYMQKRKEQQARYVEARRAFQIEKTVSAFHRLSLYVTGSPYCFLSLSCLPYILPPIKSVAISNSRNRNLYSCTFSC